MPAKPTTCSSLSNCWSAVLPLCAARVRLGGFKGASVSTVLHVSAVRDFIGATCSSSVSLSDAHSHTISSDGGRGVLGERGCPSWPSCSFSVSLSDTLSHTFSSNGVRGVRGVRGCPDWVRLDRRLRDLKEEGCGLRKGSDVKDLSGTTLVPARLVHLAISMLLLPPKLSCRHSNLRSLGLPSET